MSPIDFTRVVISQCDDLKLTLQIHEVVRYLTQSAEARLFQEELSEAQTRLADAQAEYQHRLVKELSEQDLIRKNIDKIQELELGSAQAIKAVEHQMQETSQEILRHCNDNRRLLLHHIRLHSSEADRWACLPAKILTKVMAFVDYSTIRSCTVVCRIWRHNLQYSDIYKRILARKVDRSLKPKVAEPCLSHRIAIRIYLSDTPGGSSAIAFDKSLAQLQKENERITVEHEETISNLRQAEHNLTELQTRIKISRQRLGALNLVRSEQINELQKMADRKKLLVAQTAEMDRKLSERRFRNVEAFLQLQEEMQQQIAESRRLDAADQELAHLKESFNRIGH